MHHPTTRRYARTLDEAFPGTPEYAQAIEAPSLSWTCTLGHWISTALCLAIGGGFVFLIIEGIIQ